MSREYLLTRKCKQSVYRVLFLSFISFSVLWSFFSGTQAYAGQASLSWEAPATNEDGTSLTDLNGYKIYYGTAPGNYTQNIDVGNVTTYNFTNLTDGQTYYFVATAYNAARVESSYSNEVAKIIPSSTQTYTLSVNKAGSGMITSSPAGISCGVDCTEVYTSGTVVTLTATPDGNSSFAGWSGACMGSGTCTVTMNAAKNVAAAFNLRSYTITATAGNGGSISPSGTVSVNYGGSQSFTITPNANYTVDNVVVDGGSMGAVTNYNLTNVTGNHSISVSFKAVTQQQNSLNVTKAGTGSGMITSTPAGISCGADCTEVYTSGTVVTLTATPDGNSGFAGWSGACTGSGTCTVTMNAAKNVAAAFNLRSYTITATAGNGGSIGPSGTVSVNYGGSQSYTITPNANYTIGSVVVDGVSAGAVTSYSFTNVTGNHSITVNFTSSPAEQPECNKGRDGERSDNVLTSGHQLRSGLFRSVYIRNRGNTDGNT